MLRAYKRSFWIYPNIDCPDFLDCSGTQRKTEARSLWPAHTQLTPASGFYIVHGSQQPIMHAHCSEGRQNSYYRGNIRAPTALRSQESAILTIVKQTFNFVDIASLTAGATPCCSVPRLGTTGLAYSRTVVKSKSGVIDVHHVIIGPCGGGNRIRRRHGGTSIRLLILIRLTTFLTTLRMMGSAGAPVQGPAGADCVIEVVVQSLALRVICEYIGQVMVQFYSSVVVVARPSEQGPRGNIPVCGAGIRDVVMFVFDRRH